MKAMAVSSDMKETQRPVLSCDSFSFEENSTAVMSDAYKFIIPVPALSPEAAEPLVYPEGHEQAGQPIVDYKNRPIGDWGLVFFNAKDQAYQAVVADGNGVIIINEVTSAQARKIDEKVRSLSPTLADLTLGNIKEVLTYTNDALALGDVYNSDRTYVTTNLSAPLSEEGVLSDPQEKIYGLKRRNKADIYQAIYVLGAFSLEGVSATVQQFDSSGVVIERQGNVRGIQPEVFSRTYKLADGQPITDLKQQLITKDIA